MDQIYHSEKTWVYCFITILSANSGLISAITLISFINLSSGHMTGNIIYLANSILNIDYHDIMLYFTPIGLFFLGAALGGVIIPFNDYTKGKKYQMFFIISAIIIFFSMIGLLLNYDSFKYSLSFVLGLQNAFSTHYGQSVARTTHLTGTLTDLGFLLTQKFINKVNIQPWKLYVRFLMIFFYFLGAFIGISLFKTIGYYGLLLSIIFYMVLLFLNYFNDKSY